MASFCLKFDSPPSYIKNLKCTIGKCKKYSIGVSFNPAHLVNSMCTNFNNFFRRCLCNIPKLNSSDSPGSGDEFTRPILFPHYTVYLVNSSLLLILHSALGNLLFTTWYFWRETWKVNHGHLGTAKTNQQVGIFMGIPSHASHFLII
jgi:hypothetical protein